MKLFIIDAIGPFFTHIERKKINWSKIPFGQLPVRGKKRKTQFAQIRDDLRQFAQAVKAVGFNTVTLDDVVHLADHPRYDDDTRQTIAVFREEFCKLFDDLVAQDLSILITMDVFSSNPALAQQLGNHAQKIEPFLVELLDGFLRDFPQVSGVILRVGESDGLDVKGHFKSQLYLKKPKDLNRLLQNLTPVFQRHGRKLILRTWTVGAYSLGDLMWHKDTLAAALTGIDPDTLILSMKHGESDFFRYLPLNKHFFYNDFPKIIELQSKREYEGCGEYPAFVGHEHERYYRELANAKNMIGLCVWCQTGGWVPFRRLAYIGDGSPWTEINTAVTLRIFRYGESLEQAIEALAKPEQNAALYEFLRLSEEVILELLYHEEFAQQKLFFRRVRIPPLVGVHWHTVFINQSVRKFLRHYVSDPEACRRAGQMAMDKIARMQTLAAELSLPTEDIRYMRETLGLLALAREYYYQPFDPSIRDTLKKAKKRYKKRYPKGTRYRYAIRLNFEPFKLRPRFLRWSLAVLLRQQRGYRLIDQIFTIHLLSYLFRLVRRTRAHWIPKFARKSAMGIDTVFK